VTVPATPANHTPQPTQNGLIMLSTSGGTTPRTPRESTSGGTTPRTPRAATPGALPHRVLSDVDAERYAAVPLDEVARAVKDIADGRPVVVVDDADRENEGDIVFAASKATPELLAFTIRYGRGLICVPMLGEDLDRLNVPQMTSQNQEHHGTAFTISVDARHDITTGISAADRAKTIQLLASPTSGPGDIVRPGHVFPLRYAEGGVLRRRGHTEAAVDLTVLAGLPPVGVVCEVIGDDGTMLRLPALREFADEHGLALISIEQLIEHRRRTERLVTRAAETVIPNAYGEWRAYGYRSDIDGAEHLALVLGDIGAGEGEAGDGEDVLARVHSECLTGDVFGSERCDCGAQLDAAMKLIATEGRGVLLYLNQEGRGIGLANKIRAYELQDEGFDTVEANERLGFKADQRDYGMGVQMLRELGVKSMRLLSNNPRKLVGIEGYGLSVSEWLPLEIAVSDTTRRYLKTKKEKLGHRLSGV